MKNSITTMLATTLLATGITTASAADKEIDPSDLTKVNTAATFNLGNNGSVKLNGSLGFGLKNGQMAMTTIEGSLNNEGHYQDSRLQYFHVFNLGNAVVPRAAASIDIIDNTSFTTAAVGGLAMFKTKVDSLTFFGRAAVLGGNYSDQTATFMNETDTDIRGGMGAVYAVWNAGADGTYFYASPEYTYMNGSIETSVAKLTLFAATPLSADRTRWAQLKLETTDTSIKNSDGIEKSAMSGTDTVVTIGYKVFF